MTWWPSGSLSRRTSRSFSGSATATRPRGGCSRASWSRKRSTPTTSRASSSGWRESWGRRSTSPLVRRPGRSVELLEGVLSAGDRDVLRASMWRIRTRDTSAVAVLAEPDNDVPGPAVGRPLDFFPTGHEIGYHTGMDARFVRGAFLQPGPALTWMRMQAPLVAEMDTPPLARVLIAADSGNGVSGELDYRHWLFVNPE